MTNAEIIGLLAERDRLKAEIERLQGEKLLRIEYQGTVYAVCLKLDRLLGNSPTRGTAVGSSLNEVIEAISEVVTRLKRQRLDADLAVIVAREERGTLQAKVEEQRKALETVRKELGNIHHRVNYDQREAAMSCTGLAIVLVDAALSSSVKPPRDWKPACLYADGCQKEGGCEPTDRMCVKPDPVAAPVETWKDEEGTTWISPTAWAYAQVCRALRSKDAENAALRSQVEAQQRVI